MHHLHCKHLQQNIDQFRLSMVEKLVNKWSIKPSLADKLADIVEWMTDKDEITTEQLVSHLGFADTTAKRYLRQLTAFGYLEQHRQS